MLPFTSYSIPEGHLQRLPESGQWLWLVLPEAPSSADTSMLSKMTGALKADMERDTFTWIVSPGEMVSISDLSKYQVRLMISFGVEPSQLGIWIDLPKPGLRVLEKFNFILTLPFAQLSVNPVAKKELWNAMQTYMELHAHGQ